MKLLLPLTLFLTSYLTVTAQIATDSVPTRTAIPDSLFRAQVIKLADRNADKKVTYGEIWTVSNIKFNGSSLDYPYQPLPEIAGIKSLKGIELFKNLDSLSIYQISITELDLSKNNRLKYLFCRASNLKTVQLPKSAPIEEIYIDGVAISDFDASYIPTLKRLRLVGFEFAYLNIKGTELDTFEGFESKKNVQICVDSLAQWEKIPNNYLKTCGNPDYCKYQLTCLLTTDLVNPSVDNTSSTSFKEYDLLGHEVANPAKNQITIRVYQDGKREKRANME